MSIQEKLTAIADAIRAKTGTTGTLTLDEMAAAIAGLDTAPAPEELSNTENSEDTPQ